MYKSKSDLRYEDESKAAPAPKAMPQRTIAPQNHSIPDGITANFTENINNGLGIGGDMINNVQPTLDQSKPLMLSKRDLENMLEEI